MLRIIKFKTVFIGITTLAVLAGCGSPPPRMAHHPDYLHALSDLRASRWMIEHRPGNWAQTADEMEAVAQIDAAIGDLKRAAYDDGKNPGYHPPVDEFPSHRGRLHAAIDYLNKARSDISREEDNQYADRLKDRAISHINAALYSVRRVFRE